MTAEIAVRAEPQKPAILRPLVRPDELIEAQKEVTQLIARALQEGTDYGKIPGTQKNTLLKPGGERITKAFGCHVGYVVVTEEIDHDRPVVYTKMQWVKGQKTPVEGRALGLYRYVIEAKIFAPQGQCVGSGIGSCSTLESKYVDRPRDLENTVLKMAQKRAMIAAVLNTFGLSDRFTQDMEPDDDEPKAGGHEPVAKSHVEPEQRDAAAKEVGGYNPQNRAHQTWLISQLKKKGITDDRWDDIGTRLQGRPSAELDSVLGAMGLA